MIDPEARKKKSLEIIPLNKEKLAERIWLYFSRGKLKPELIVAKGGPPI